MNQVNLEQIKELRSKTGASVSLCQKALIESKGDLNKALQFLRKKGEEIAQKREDKETEAGIIEAYIHNNQKIGVLLELVCETDFVARNEKFKELARDLAMHIAALNPKNIKELEKQSFIKDESITVNDLMNEKISQLGENIKIKRFIRYQIGEK